MYFNEFDVILEGVKVDRQKFTAVFKKLIATPPMSKADIDVNPKRGRPRKKSAPKKT